MKQQDFVLIAGILITLLLIILAGRLRFLHREDKTEFEIQQRKMFSWLLLAGAIIFFASSIILYSYLIHGRL